MITVVFTLLVGKTLPIDKQRKMDDNDLLTEYHCTWNVNKLCKFYFPKRLSMSSLKAQERVKLCRLLLPKGTRHHQCSLVLCNSRTLTAKWIANFLVASRKEKRQWRSNWVRKIWYKTSTRNVWVAIYWLGKVARHNPQHPCSSLQILKQRNFVK